jgi:hypothetical protein
MPEIQHSNQPGEMTQRFIELVMMQAQQAAMFLGRLPGPEGQQPEVNLEFARMFIDQLEMLQEKTRGNLSNEETQVLNGVLADLRLAFVQASGAPSAPQHAAAPAPVEAPKVEAAVEHESENRKRFSKSYGS